MTAVDALLNMKRGKNISDRGTLFELCSKLHISTREMSERKPKNTLIMDVLRKQLTFYWERQVNARLDLPNPMAPRRDVELIQRPLDEFPCSAVAEPLPLLCSKEVQTDGPGLGLNHESKEAFTQTAVPTSDSATQTSNVGRTPTRSTRSGTVLTSGVCTPITPSSFHNGAGYHTPTRQYIKKNVTTKHRRRKSKGFACRPKKKTTPQG